MLGAPKTTKVQMHCILYISIENEKQSLTYAIRIWHVKKKKNLKKINIHYLHMRKTPQKLIKHSAIRLRYNNQKKKKKKTLKNEPKPTKIRIMAMI